jgi:hypothetical protein
LEAINRRHFVGGSAALLGTAVLELPALSAFAAPLPHPDHAFFDQRFETARRVAASWPASMRPVAVLGDITPWTALLDRARERPLQLCGVTTESFRFCAAILAGEHAETGLKVSRLDRDLVLWSMRTTPRGTIHG